MGGVPIPSLLTSGIAASINDDTAGELNAHADVAAMIPRQRSVEIDASYRD